jgi:hypothetical protein
MRQIALIPGGCHQCLQPVVYASSSVVLFASKLSLYIMDSETFIIKKIMTTQISSMLSMSVNPNDENLIVVSGSDQYLAVWKIDTEECILKISVGGADILAWDTHDPNNILVIKNEERIIALSWYCNIETKSFL